MRLYSSGRALVQSCCDLAVTRDDTGYSRADAALPQLVSTRLQHVRYWPLVLSFLHALDFWCRWCSDQDSCVSTAHAQGFRLFHIRSRSSRILSLLRVKIWGGCFQLWADITFTFSLILLLDRRGLEKKPTSSSPILKPHMLVSSSEHSCISAW